MRVHLVALTIVACVALSGCPLGTADDNSPTPGIQRTAAGAAADAVAKALNDEDKKYPPPPSLDQLCALRFEKTSFDQAKQIFGPPTEESMDKTQAGLSYRYQERISMILSFDWHDGQPGFGTIITGIGSTDAFDKGYLLSMASINGTPYPPCWPHEEP